MSRTGTFIPFLDERLASDESVVQAMILTRPTYTVAYLAIAQADGTFRVTHRGTGLRDYFFDTLLAHDPWEVERHQRLLHRRFGLDAPTISKSVRYYTDREEAIAALTSLPADD